MDRLDRDSINVASFPLYRLAQVATRASLLTVLVAVNKRIGNRI